MQTFVCVYLFLFYRQENAEGKTGIWGTVVSFAGWKCLVQSQFQCASRCLELKQKSNNDNDLTNCFLHFFKIKSSFRSVHTLYAASFRRVKISTSQWHDWHSSTIVSRELLLDNYSTFQNLVGKLVSDIDQRNKILGRLVRH